MRNNKILLVVLFFMCATSAFAMDGHSGISFSMSQKDIEALGFVCQPPNKNETRCFNDSYKGDAFGYPTTGYEVDIGDKNTVRHIKTKLSGKISLADYDDLCKKIEQIFPTKNEKATFRKNDLTIDGWIADNRAKAFLFVAHKGGELEPRSAAIAFSSPEY